MPGSRAALVLPRRRSFAIYLGATLVTLILLSASGFGDWGVAHGQTAPGRHAGAKTAESTPGPPGAASATGSDQPASPFAASPIGATSVAGMWLIVAGIALMLIGAARAFRRSHPGATGAVLDPVQASADSVGPASADSTRDE